MALVIILLAIGSIVALLFLKPFDGSKDIAAIMLACKNQGTSDSLIHASQKELIEIIQAEKKEYRTFFLQVAQMILLNLLLPILTAIIGYRVGAASDKE